MKDRSRVKRISLILIVLFFLPSQAYTQNDYMENVCKRIKPIILGMGFIQARNSNYCTGSYYLGGTDGRTKINLPQFKRQNNRPDRRYVQVTEQYTRWVNSSRIDIDRISPAAVQRSYELIETQNNRADEDKTSGHKRLVDGKIEQQILKIKVKHEGSLRSYGKYKGGMYLSRAVGQTVNVTGYASGLIGDAVPLNDIVFMTAFFEFRDNEGHKFGIRVGIAMQSFGHRYPGIPVITESQVNGILTSYAQFLEAELKTPGDDYFEWLTGYLEGKLNLEQQTRVVSVGLSTIAKRRKTLRNKWKDLMQMEMDTELDRGDASIGLTDIFDTQAVRPSLRTVISFHDEREKLRTQMNDLREIQTVEMAKVFKAIAALRTSVEGQAKKGGDRKEYCEKEAQLMKDKETLLRIQLFDAAEWYGPQELPALIRQLDFENNAVPEVAWQMKAKLNIAQAETFEERLWFQIISPRPQPPDQVIITAARTARFEALLAYRRILEKDPGNESIKQSLLEIELHFLKTIGNKLEREQKQTQAAMGAYLTNRGFSADDRPGFWSGLLEYITVTWGLGPISLLAGFPGVDVPGAVAETVDITQTEIAKNLVSMVAITRLRKNGLTLKEIRNITPKILVEKIMFNNSKGEKLSDEKATQFVRDIRETFLGLGDLQALADGDLLKFNKRFGQSYYSAIDAEQSRGEYYGDLFSPKNLITLFGPSAIVKVAGKYTMPRLMMTPTEIAFAEHAGLVIRGRDVLAAALPVQMMGEWFTSTRLGYLVQQEFIRGQLLTGQLPRWASFINTGLNIGAAAILTGAASYCAAESGIPGAQLLVDALFDFGAEELAFDILSKSGTPFRKLLGEVDDYGRYVIKQKGDWGKLSRDLDELDMIQRRGFQTGDISDTDLQHSQELMGTLRHSDELPNIPVDRKTAFAHGFHLAAEEIRKGNYDKAARAIGFSKAMQARVQSNMDLILEKINKVKTFLGSHLSSPNIRPQRELKKIHESDLPELFVRENMYPPTPSGAHLLAGDEAFRRGKLDEALEQYHKARYAGLDAKPGSQLDQAGLDLIDDRMALVSNTRKSARILKNWQDTTPPLPADRAIPEDRVGTLVRQIEADDKVTEITGSANTVFRIVHENADGTTEHYIFKAISKDDAADAAVTETICATLAEAAGLRAPAVRRLDAAEIQRLKSRFPNIKEGLVSRAVDGTDLTEVTEPIVTAMKAQYAQQRVFRAWIGDPDGHLRNQLLAGDGRLWQIDFELGNLTDRRIKQLDVILPNERSFVAQAVDFPKGSAGLTPDLNFSREYRQALDRELGDHPLYQWMNRMDDMIHYNEMEETIEAIGKLVNDKGGIRLKARLRDASLPESEVDTIYTILKERQEHLEDIFKERFNHRIQPDSVSGLHFNMKPFGITSPPLHALVSFAIAA
ncbi:MAG: hypothetical protein MUP70_14960 [Candidatus Aminicenantes bacterium]|nr:hypothetical protein [Candidatus Aminicenantes bacterium]